MFSALRHFLTTKDCACKDANMAGISLGGFIRSLAGNLRGDNAKLDRVGLETSKARAFIALA
jgi:hypothetical protein